MHSTRRLSVLIPAIVGVFSSAPAHACLMHELLGITEPTGVWPDASTPTPATKTTSASLSAITFGSVIADPSVTGWKMNVTGVHAHSNDPQINSYVSSILADVQTVAYDSTNVYVHSTDVPSHNVGAFPGNPAYPSDRNLTVQIPRMPVVNTVRKPAWGWARWA